MLRRITVLLGMVVALLVISATAAMAHTLNVKVTATCACVYSVTASGNTDANAVVGIDLAFNVTQDGVTYFLRDQAHRHER